MANQTEYATCQVCKEPIRSRWDMSIARWLPWELYRQEEHWEPHPVDVFYVKAADQQSTPTQVQGALEAMAYYRNADPAVAPEVRKSPDEFMIGTITDGVSP